MTRRRCVCTVAHAHTHTHTIWVLLCKLTLTHQVVIMFGAAVKEFAARLMLFTETF